MTHGSEELVVTTKHIVDSFVYEGKDHAGLQNVTRALGRWMVRNPRRILAVEYALSRCELRGQNQVTLKQYMTYLCI